MALPGPVPPRTESSSPATASMRPVRSVFARSASSSFSLRKPYGCCRHRAPLPSPNLHAMNDLAWAAARSSSTAE